MKKPEPYLNNDLSLRSANKNLQEFERLVRYLLSNSDSQEEILQLHFALTQVLNGLVCESVLTKGIRWRKTS